MEPAAQPLATAATLHWRICAAAAALWCTVRRGTCTSNAVGTPLCCRAGRESKQVLQPGCRNGTPPAPRETNKQRAPWVRLSRSWAAPVLALLLAWGPSPDRRTRTQSLDGALPVPGQAGLRRQRRALFPVVLHLQRPYPGRLISLEHAGLGLADVK